MAIYVYPAVFVAEEEGGYSVNFPDVESCYTSGDNMSNALEMAEDVLCMMLYEYEQSAETFRNKVSPPSDPKSFKLKDNETVSLVRCDTAFYKRFYENKSVKKTLTIPAWLNEAAGAKNINFSQTLQNALLEQLELA
ncbi:MAG: type II toxin-antitoxin system HicB family antitoxin [Oscillospiraceae bacterium]|nr:type II toxin-antitoxin system HicB family antitoxin [Oscillospiraceae bacterium]